MRRARGFCRREGGTLSYVAKDCFQEECDERTGVATPYPVHGDIARNATLVGSDTFTGLAFDVDIKGTIAYVAAATSVRAYDLSNPNALTLLGSVAVPQGLNDIEISPTRWEPSE